MSGHTERVEMISSQRRMVLFMVALGMILWVAWKLQEVTALERAWQILGPYWHLVIATVGLLTLAMTNQMTIELTSECLTVGAGISWRRIKLKDISNAKAVAELEPPTWWSSWVGVHSSTVSHLVRTGIVVTLMGGKTVEVSSDNPDHLAAMINDLVRQDLLSNIAEPESPSVARLRRWFSWQ